MRRAHYLLVYFSSNHLKKLQFSLVYRVRLSEKSEARKSEFRFEKERGKILEDSK